jgi:hypothetical protein
MQEEETLDPMPPRLVSVPVLGVLLCTVCSFPQTSNSPIALDIPASFAIRYQADRPSQCYRVVRPPSGRITATVSGPGSWDVCIGDQSCPHDCFDSGQRTATTEPLTQGGNYFVRVVTKSPGTMATLSIRETARNVPAVSVTGTWTVVFKGRATTTMTLQQTGNSVTGNLATTDGSRGYVAGKLSGAVLTLSRVTGLDTTQHYEVTVQGDVFSGSYRNTGRLPDSGSFTGRRKLAAPEAATAAGTWTVVFNGRTSTAMTLEQSGDTVTGNLVTTDGSRGQVTGNLSGAVLTLTRITGRNTTQHYRVTLRGNTFTGTFHNQGHYTDSGSFTGTRR